MKIPKKNEVKEYKFHELEDLLDQIDDPAANNIVSKEPTPRTQSSFEKKLQKFIKEEKEVKKAVLGIDIYRYSKVCYDKQKIMPFLFSLLIRNAKRFFLHTETFFTSTYEERQLDQELIHTGDGGYLFFDTPLDSLIFALHFNNFLHLFNSYHMYPKLRKYIGPVTLRYAITYDRAYKIDRKFFGPAIIRNARIISKDKLNRFLIDDNTYEWFLLNTNGIENLTNITTDDIKHLNKKQNNKKSILFKPERDSRIRNINCQKIDQILVKEDSFDIYNIMIQFLAKFRSDDDKISFITTIGNMNCNGI